MELAIDSDINGGALVEELRRVGKMHARHKVEGIEFLVSVNGALCIIAYVKVRVDF